ncbi:unnamed protein product [Rhizoctonia solani]|uniref:NodB homology domain-containing protein n=1 Tax=Rhizoctonia solani TaxID=456999 RepID=A0A8H3GRA5_9AGAM|nr:unnamed protein product [Rhizoctonia solani]
MQFLTKLALVGSVASSLLGALAVPLTTSKVPRQLAQVITKCTVPNTVALTFDDGPHVYMYDISKAIIAAGGKATFFVNGNNYGCIYDADNVKRVKYLYDKVHDEMWRVEEALQRILGVNPAFMRPPFGSYNDNVLAASAVRGQKVAIWDFDSGDSTGATPAQSKQKYTDIANQRPSTILTLNHETYERTAHEVIPHAISMLQAKGYRLVTLAECLGEQPYQSVGSPATGSWTC